MPNQLMIDRLRKLLTHYDHAAASLRTTIALLADAPDARTIPKNGHHPSIPVALQTAIAQERKRRTGTRRPYRRGGKNGAAAKRRQRQRTADRLAKFDPTTPRPGTILDAPATVGTLVRYGFLKAKGDGFIRTAKPFPVAPETAGR